MEKKQKQNKNKKSCEALRRWSPRLRLQKYPSVCCCPAGWRRVVVPTTSAPGRRQHRAAEWALASAWTEPFTRPEQPSALAARSLFLSRTELHGVSRSVCALHFSSAALRRALTTASCLPPLLGETDQWEARSPAAVHSGRWSSTLSSQPEQHCAMGGTIKDKYNII